MSSRPHLGPSYGTKAKLDKDPMKAITMPLELGQRETLLEPFPYKF